MEFQVSLWPYILVDICIVSNISISVTWGDDELNYSLHSIQKYTQSFILFVGGIKQFPRVKFKKTCELCETDYVQGRNNILAYF